MVSPTRGNSYTLISDWADLFKDPSICLINLQYGKCEEELVPIENQFDIKIERWSDTNLQIDLGAVAAIIQNLDVICTVGTVVAQIGGAVGTPTLLCANSYNWTSFGTQRFPYFSNIHLIVDQDNGDMQVAAQNASKIVAMLQK